MSKPIKSFWGKYRFLSNFYPCFINYKGIIYPSVEHAYQAQKTKDRKVQEHIAKLFTPLDAKHYGRKLPLFSSFEDEKLVIMKDLIRLKFQNKILRKYLISTKDAELIEGNKWGDIFWGVDIITGQGENHLGKIIMEVRKEIYSSI